MIVSIFEKLISYHQKPSSKHCVGQSDVRLLIKNAIIYLLDND